MKSPFSTTPTAIGDRARGAAHFPPGFPLGLGPEFCFARDEEVSQPGCGGLLFSIHLCWPRVRFGFSFLHWLLIALPTHTHTHSNRFRFLFIYTLSCLPWQHSHTSPSYTLSPPANPLLYIHIFFCIIGSIYFSQLFLPAAPAAAAFVFCLFMLHFDFLSLNCICCFYFR